MNVNEVIACRANELITGKKGYDVVHPNTHVNMGQSTNDVIPAAIEMSVHANLLKLGESLKHFETALSKKQKEHENALRLGRTCLQDAVPMTFGQYFSGYVSLAKRMKAKFSTLLDEASELPLGATAIGTSLSVHEGYLSKVYEKLI